MQKTLDKILPEVCGCAFAAGQEILRLYREDAKPSKKQDGSPVTAADLASNDIITKHLSYITPGTTIVSEENVPEEVNVRKDFWLIDPLDGTKAFINKTDEFAVSIALIRKQQPVLGVIYVPVKNEVYAAVNLPNKRYAYKGEGSVASTPIATRSMPQNNPVLLLGNRQAFTDEMVAFLEPYAPFETVICSSAIKFCMIADGKADLYIRVNSLFEWDTAAGQAIVEAAGGVVRNWYSRTAVDYGKPGWVNDGFFVYGQ